MANGISVIKPKNGRKSKDRIEYAPSDLTQADISNVLKV